MASCGWGRVRAGRASQRRARCGRAAVPRSGAALILIHGRIRQWGHIWGLPNALLEKPTVLQTAPLYPSGSLGRMNRFKMKRRLVALLLRSDSKQDARLQIQAGRRGTVGRGEIDDPAAETA